MFDTRVCIAGFAFAVTPWLSCCYAIETPRADFEALPAPAKTYPRPREGEVLAVNPPCFVYPAKQKYDSYVVQYSSSREFAPAVTSELAGKWMLNVPRQSLEPGVWYWRWRPATPGAEPVAWSTVREFRIPNNVPSVPFPHLSELVQRLGRSHPRVLVTADSLDAMRRRARVQFGPSWLKQIQQRAESAAKKRLLPEPAFLPAKQPERIEQYKATFVRYRPFFGEMTALAEAYVLSDNKLAGAEARRRLMSIVRWNPKGSTSLKNNDEVGTDVVRHGPRAYDWIYPLLSADQRQECLRAFRIRMDEMFDVLRKRPFEVAPYPSHFMGYYEPDLLQACLAVSGDLDVSRMLHYTMLQLWSPFYPPYGDAEGGWSEGPSYWGWIAGVCARTYVLVERATGIPIHQRSNLRNQAYYKLYGNPPWFQMSPFGDGQEGPAGGGRTMLMLASLYQNASAKWYAEQKKTRLSGIDGLLFPTGDIEAKPPAELPQGRRFLDVGLGCSHTNLSDGDQDVAFLMRSSPFGGSSHAYADHNTFVLDAFGEPLIIASGYYQLYGCPHHAQWTRQTIASNSILVDNHGQERSWTATGRIREFATTVGADYEVGDAHVAYSGRLEKFDRHVLFLRPMQTGGDALIVIRDEIVAAKPATIQFLLHALQRMEVDEAAQTVRIRRGNAVCRVDLLAPQSLTFRQHDQFIAAPQLPSPNQWHLQAGTTIKQKKTESLMTLQPVRHAFGASLVRPELERGAGAVAAVLDDGARRVVVLFRTDADADTVSAGGLRTDGNAASVTWIDGHVHAAAMFDGTSLATKDNRSLLQAASATSLSIVHANTGILVESAGATATKVTLDMPFSSAEAVYPTGTRVPLTVGDANVSLDVPPAQLIRIEPSSDKNTDSQRLVPLTVPGVAPARFQRTYYPRVQQTTLKARFPGSPGIWRLDVHVAVTGDNGGLLRFEAGGVSTVSRLEPGQEPTVTLPACSLDRGDPVTISWVSATGGRLELRRATAKRMRGVNLLPNPSFEVTADGMPTRWRAGSITRGARCRIETAVNPFPDRVSEDDRRCVKVVCTAATGGDFSVTLRWAGIRPTPDDRRFRLACRVVADAGSVAGVQVTSADWEFTRTTPRISSPDKWTESAREFVLPAGENIGHLRLHMSAKKVGAVLYVDTVSLVELPESGGAAREH